MTSLQLDLRRLFLVALIVMTTSTGLCGVAAAGGPLLLRNPSLSKDKIAFLYADDIWTVPRGGGEAERLTSVGAVHEGPYFSPDGTQIAYSTLERGQVDVYVVSAEGGVPRRLTWEPTGNYAVGWTPDGKDVLFASMHASYSDFFRLFETHADGIADDFVSFAEGEALVAEVGGAGHGVEIAGLRGFLHFGVAKGEGACEVGEDAEELFQIVGNTVLVTGKRRDADGPPRCAGPLCPVSTSAWIGTG